MKPSEINIDKLKELYLECFNDEAEKGEIEISIESYGEVILGKSNVDGMEYHIRDTGQIYELCKDNNEIYGGSNITKAIEWLKNNKIYPFA